MEITVREAPIQLFNDFISLLDQVGDWLWKKGIKQWEPEIHSKNHDNLFRLVKKGHLILANQDDKLVGGCILSEIIPEIWSDDPNALYLSKLVVARSVAGHDIGRRIIRHCVKIGKEKRKSYIRLDCWDGNDFLKSYYKKEGFVMLKSVRENNYRVRLFEMNIT